MPMPGVPIQDQTAAARIEGARARAKTPTDRKESRGMSPRSRHSTGANLVPTTVLLILGVLLLPLVACGGGGGDGGDAVEGTQEAAEPVSLGPLDGHSLPPTELERVAVGTLAPDFALQTIDGDTLVLSAFRGVKNVILVFYRGHW
jgi:hypothetical protein